MSVYLYKLYAIQEFDGEKIAVYVYNGNYPHDKIIEDAQSIVDGLYSRKEVIEYNDWVYADTADFPHHGPTRRKELTHFTRVIKFAQDVIDKHEFVDKAIFVNSANKKDWRGERTLYRNKILSTVKADTPDFSGCIPKGTFNYKRK